MKERDDKESGPHQRNDIVGAVLAGGQSRRMGEDKGALVLDDGRTFLDAVVTVMKRVTPTVVVLGHGRGLTDTTGVTTLADMIDDAGPLAGIATLAENRLTFTENRAASVALIVTCDAPDVSHALLQQLCDACLDDLGRDDSDVEDARRPRAHAFQGPDGFPLFFPCAIPLERARAVLASSFALDGDHLGRGSPPSMRAGKSRSVGAFLNALDLKVHAVSDDDAKRLRGVNSPDELAAARSFSSSHKETKK